MKKLIFVLAAALVLTVALGCSSSNARNNGNNPDQTLTSANRDGVVYHTRIQVALLLDTSNSMDGLIEQAKARLWNIVNTLSTLKYKGAAPEVQIALYEYGNDWLDARTGYIRQVVPLTTDLDLISEKLFSLRTNGGLEYCGAVIADALKDLRWSDGQADMKLVYIAGNEEFNQGHVSYKESCAAAQARGVYINTIYCGGYQAGIQELWQAGATSGGGKYFNIDHDARVTFISTPYDDALARCNQRLNDTYISYGVQGVAKKQSQAAQDVNAESVSAANYAERVVTKSKSSVYRNESWDLVDKVAEDSKALASISQAELPAELQGKTEAEVRQVVDQKATERAAIQREIDELAVKRQAYIDEQAKNSGTAADDLGAAINASILAFAQTKGFDAQ